MIQVVTGTTVKRDEAVVINPNTVIGDHLASKGYDVEHGTFALNNRFLGRSDLSKTFAEFDPPSSGPWTLLDVEKTRNA